MPYDGFNDDVWDEHKWEAHLDEIERNSAHLRDFISPETAGNLPRWMILLQENADELEAVDAYIEEELQIEEAYFPDEDDEEDWEDEEFDEDLDGFFYDDYDEDDFDDGEEWKEFSDAYAMSDYGSLDNIEIYNDARELAAFVLQWAEGIHPASHTEEYHNFIGKVLKIGAKLAGGYSFGFEIDYLGGNIAYTKKALHCANEALILLQDAMKPQPFMDRATYGLFHERLFELRNGIGIYVQDLREMFRSDL